jgi:hypothetical protein
VVQDEAEYCSVDDGRLADEPETTTHKEGFTEPRDEKPEAEYPERWSTTENDERDRLEKCSHK